MRKLIYAINLSADGCCDHTKIGGSEEMLNFYAEFLEEADLIIYGRKTYELMIPYWPDVLNDPTATKAEHEYARIFGAIDKLVFSKTLTTVEEKNARLVQDNLVEEITKLKQEEGKNMVVGGVDLPSQMLALGLIDEFQLVIRPAIVGEGRRLFDETNLQERLGLTLIASKVFKSGSVMLRYIRQ